MPLLPHTRESPDDTGRPRYFAPGPGRRLDARRSIGRPDAGHLAERDAGYAPSRDRRVRLRPARSDDSNARRSQAAHRHPRAPWRPRRAHSPDPHALQRRRAHDARSELPPRPHPERLRQRHRGDRRGRLHPGRPGRAGQVRLRGRLRDESPAARAAEPDGGRSLHRYLGHYRLAGEAHAREQREGGHPRHLLRRLLAADGPRQPASGAQGGRAHEPDGGRLDGRRLVPQRRLPPAEHVLHLRAGGHPRQHGQVVHQRLRRLRHVHEGRLGGRAGPDPRARAGRLLAQAPGAPKLRRVLAEPGRGQGAGRPAAQGPHDAGPQPLGRGGHLWRHRRLQGARAEGHRQRQGVPGDGPVAPRRGDRGRQHAGRPPLRDQHALYFQRQILRPFLDHYLKDDAPRADVAPVSAFETGTNTWRRLDAWPAGCADGCTIAPKPLYLLAGSRLGFTRAKERRHAVRRVRLRSRQARALPCAADPAGRVRQRTDLARLAGGRSARGIRPAGRAGVHLRRR